MVGSAATESVAASDLGSEIMEVPSRVGWGWSSGFWWMVIVGWIGFGFWMFGLDGLDYWFTFVVWFWGKRETNMFLVFLFDIFGFGEKRRCSKSFKHCT